MISKPHPLPPIPLREWGGTRFHVGPGRERTPTMGEIMRVRRCTLPNCAGGKGAHQINSQPIAYSSTPQIKLRLTLTGLHIYLGKRRGPSLILAALRTPGGFPGRSAREASLHISKERRGTCPSAPDNCSAVPLTNLIVVFTT